MLGSGFVSSSARLYRSVRVDDSFIGDESIIADNSDVLRSTISCHCEIGRRNLIVGSSLGVGTYTGSNTVIHDVDIGKFCCISWDVSLGGFSHDYEAASLYSKVNWLQRFGIALEEKLEERPRTRIGNDVWLASGVNVIGGVSIGDGAVLGAGAVVVDDIPPYAIAVGVPARVIKFRFPESYIDRLLAIAWWDWPWDTIRANASLLGKRLDDDLISELKEVANAISAR